MVDMTGKTLLTLGTLAAFITLAVGATLFVASGRADTASAQTASLLANNTAIAAQVLARQVAEAAAKRADEAEVRIRVQENLSATQTEKIANIERILIRWELERDKKP